MANLRQNPILLETIDVIIDDGPREPVIIGDEGGMVERIVRALDGEIPVFEQGQPGPVAVMPMGHQAGDEVAVEEVAVAGVAAGAEGVPHVPQPAVAPAAVPPPAGAPQRRGAAGPAQGRGPLPDWRLGAARTSRLSYQQRADLFSMPETTDEERTAKAAVVRRYRADPALAGPTLAPDQHPHFRLYGQLFNDWRREQRGRPAAQQVAPAPAAVAPVAPPAAPAPQPALPECLAVGQVPAHVPVGACPGVQRDRAEPEYDPPGSERLRSHFGDVARKYYMRSTVKNHHWAWSLAVSVLVVCFAACCALFHRVEVLAGLVAFILLIFPCAVLHWLGEDDDLRLAAAVPPHEPVTETNPLLWRSIGRCRPMTGARLFLWVVMIVSIVVCGVLGAIGLWITTVEVLASAPLVFICPCLVLLMTAYICYSTLRRDIGLTAKLCLTLYPPNVQAATRVTMERELSNGTVEEVTATLDDRQAADQFSTMSDEFFHVGYGMVTVDFPGGDGGGVESFARFCAKRLIGAGREGRVAYSLELLTQYQTAAASCWTNTVEDMIAKVFRTSVLYSKSPFRRGMTLCTDDIRNGSAWIAAFLVQSRAEIAASELPLNVVPQVKAFSI